MEYIPRLKKKYKDEVVNSLRGNYKSIMQVPKLVKICLNQGIGSAASDKKQIEAAQHEMSIITGQKAVLTKSKKDISNFKLRKGMPVGVMVTLRGDKMYEFLDRLITSTIPRIRDFNGISEKGFDGQGNYTLGIKEQISFSEISIDKINKVTGMDITFVTSAISDNEALDLLKELGMPFKTNNSVEKLREEKINKRKEEEKKEVEKKSKEESLDTTLINEDASSEDVSSEDASSEDVSSEDASSEDVSSEDVSSEDASSEDVSSEDVSSEDNNLENKE